MADTAEVGKRLVFMGTPEFSCPVLARLLSEGYEITCVYSQPPRPAGRGQHEQLSPVHKLALQHGLEVRTPANLRDEASQKAFAALKADAAIVVAYGLILPPVILAAPAYGCINLHASLLPRWRGAAPIQRAIMAGDRTSGVSVMQMERGLDTGPVLRSREIPIYPKETAGQLHSRLAAEGATLLVQTLSALFAGNLIPEPQPESGVTYAAKIDKTETKIDWSQSNVTLDRHIRAFSPHPGAWFTFNGERIKILLAEPIDGEGPAGTVLDAGLAVGCGAGALRLLKLQRAGRGVLDTAAFLQGYPIAPGAVLS